MNEDRQPQQTEWCKLIDPECPYRIGQNCQLAIHHLSFYYTRKKILKEIARLKNIAATDRQRFIDICAAAYDDFIANAFPPRR